MDFNFNGNHMGGDKWSFGLNLLSVILAIMSAATGKDIIIGLTILSLAANAAYHILGAYEKFKNIRKTRTKK
jgi:hypothetical protein